jgi:tetratricopeptide (TPR) repeat protein
MNVYRRWTIMPLPEPERYVDLLAELRTVWGVEGEIHLLSEYGEGKSSARVFLVDIQSEAHRGKAVLKLGTPKKWTDEDPECVRHQHALDAVPEFSSAHLPALIGWHERDGQVAALMTVAGDMTRTNELYKIDYQTQAQVLPKVSRAILEEWNKDYTISPPVTPGDVMRDWLAHRLDPVQSQINPFMRDKCALTGNDSSFSLDGRWFPNPYAYAIRDNLWPQSHELVAARGQIHGDLHGHNILVRVDGPTSSSYFIIDLALYRPKTYLFYDHGYLELAYLLHRRSWASFSRWLQIVHALDDQNEAIEIDDHGIVVLLRQMRRELHVWIDAHEHDRVEFMQGQVLLGRVAAGLNFVNKGQASDQERKLAMLYAAVNLKCYLDMFHLHWEKDGPVLEFDVVPQVSPGTDEWRTVWNACTGFDPNRNVYLMITDPSLRRLDPKLVSVLGRIPWASVIDFDLGTEAGGLLDTLRPVILTHRAFRQTEPQNVHNLNFDNATNWFRAVDPVAGMDQLQTSLQGWRRSYLTQIRALANRLKEFVSPRPIMCVFLVPSLPADVVRALWQTLDEVLADYARYVLVHSGNVSAASVDGASNVELSNCSFSDFLAGLWRMYGSSDSGTKVVIPMRGGSLTLSDENYRFLREDLEIVHPGLSRLLDEEGRVGYDFWRGNEITWAELDMHTDVWRPEADKLREHILGQLDGSRVFEVSLRHTAGAGGTTVAKRVAWDIKDTYPTVVVHHYSENTVSRIESLFHLTKLPVVIVMEEARVPVSSQIKLRNALLGRNVRAGLLSVARRIAPKGDVILSDPLETQEARRFAATYKAIALPERKLVLDRLVDDKGMLPYRSPFFFGLYSFEKEFVHIPEFVRFHLDGITETTAKIVNYLALVTRFSQAYLTEAEIKTMVGLASDRPLRLEELLGDAAARLVVYRNQQARLLHPLIAEEVLKQLLGGNGLVGDHWKEQLTDLSCQFVDELTDVCGPESESLQELLFQLFISRDFWENEGRRQFSELILAIPNEAGQHRVLGRLVERCPEEAHFWNHLGRHHMYVMKSSYEEAENCLLQAIDLDPENDIHPHALGMVYRFAINDRLEGLARDKVSADTAARSIEDLAEKAERCFDNARDLDQETEYGYITNIQLLGEIINRLFRLSRCDSYAQFLSSVGSAAIWVRRKLPWAEELLRRVKALQSEENLSHHTRLCDAQIQGFYDQYETMISSLQRLLVRDSTQRPTVRRVIAHAMYTHQGHTWQSMHVEDLRMIDQLMSENLEYEPTNSRDLWMWFQAYRRLQSFDDLEAIDRLNRWAAREASADAHYYLYMLHFLRYKAGILDDQQLVLRHISQCKTHAQKVRRTRCFEWLAREPLWCPLVHQSELGEWKNGFYEKVHLLAEVRGTVAEVKGPQTGTISLDRLPVFFVPGADILPERDEGKPARFHLGFSYDGLRAWKVQLER